MMKTGIQVAESLALLSTIRYSRPWLSAKVHTCAPGKSCSLVNVYDHRFNRPPGGKHLNWMYWGSDLESAADDEGPL